MRQLHHTTGPLVDSTVEHIANLINAAVESGDIANAASIYAEWQEWLTEGDYEITCLPLLSETID